MSIIYKYIYKELLTPFFFGIAAFTAIFIGTDLIFELTEYYTKWGVDILTLLKLFFLSLPSIIVLTFPMGTLLATIMGYSRLSGDSEITALRAGGVSIYKLILPALILGLLMSGITIVINEFVVPKANYEHKQIVYEFKHGEQMPKTQYNLYLTPLEKNRPDYILYTYRFNGETGEMNDVLLHEYEDGDPVALIKAKKAKWLENGWEFYDGSVFHLKEGERIPAMTFSEYRSREDIHEPDRIASLDKNPEEMNLRELADYISNMEEQGKNAYEEKLQWHQNISIPFANFIFALLAAPLGIKPGRSSGSATGFGLSVLVIFIYYAIMTIGGALGGQGTIAPWFGAWMQNFIFLLIGGILIYRVGK
ncbi:MAG: LptF/LptG family permease [Halanaerobiales bacterium]